MTNSFLAMLALLIPNPVPVGCFFDALESRDYQAILKQNSFRARHGKAVMRG